MNNYETLVSLEGNKKVDFPDFTLEVLDSRKFKCISKTEEKILDIDDKTKFQIKDTPVEFKKNGLLFKIDGKTYDLELHDDNKIMIVRVGIMDKLKNN